MKRIIASLLLCYIGQTQAQELQLHYDYLKDRQYLTATFEMFKPDDYGSTFMFTDVDFNRYGGGASLVYFEIARKFTIPNRAIDGLNVHVEYNDGFLSTKSPNPIAIPINRSFLTGVGLPVKIGGLTLHTSYLYKHIQGSNGLDGQFTAVWFKNFFNNKMTLRGFFDIWSQPKTFGVNTDDKKAVILTEPQILYNINPHFSVGSEVEISHNFIPGTEGWRVFPTIMGRWLF